MRGGEYRVGRVICRVVIFGIGIWNLYYAFLSHRHDAAGAELRFALTGWLFLAICGLAMLSRPETRQGKRVTVGEDSFQVMSASERAALFAPRPADASPQPDTMEPTSGAPAAGDAVADGLPVVAYSESPKVSHDFGSPVE